MKKVIDRFVVEDVDGRFYTVMCIQQYVAENDLDTAIRGNSLTWQTTQGEFLTTSDNASFKVTGTNRFLNKISVARSSKNIVRLRGLSMGAVPIY